MFAVPALSLLSAIRRDPFAVSSTTLGDLCYPEFPLPASGLSFGQKIASKKGQKHANLAKPRKMNTCKNRAATLVK